MCLQHAGNLTPKTNLQPSHPAQVIAAQHQHPEGLQIPEPRQRLHAVAVSIEDLQCGR